MTWRDVTMIAVGAVLGCGLLWGVLAWEAGTAPFFPKAQHGPCMCVRATGQCLCPYNFSPGLPGKKTP